MFVTGFGSAHDSVNNVQLHISFFGEAQLDRRWHSDNLISVFNRLYLVEEGEAYLWSDKQHIIMKPGNAYLLPAGMPLSFRCDTVMRKLYFHFNLFRPDHYDILQSFRQIGEVPIPLETIRQLRSRGQGDSFADSMMVRYLLEGVLMQLQEKYVFAQESMPSYSEHIRETLSYIQSNLSADLRLEELAKRRFVSVSFLTALFRKEMGISIGQYIDDQLMSEAQRMLNQTNASLLEISRALGYSDQCYFSRRFKQLCGMTPRQYRKNIGL